MRTLDFWLKFEAFGVETQYEGKQRAKTKSEHRNRRNEYKQLQNKHFRH